MKTVNEMIMNGEYDLAIKEIKKELKEEPENHYLLFELSSAYYEKHRYKTALKYAEEALRICPECPMGLWHYASALLATSEKHKPNKDKAYLVYKSLLKRGMSGLDADPCSEGHEHNLGLLNDCRFMAALCSQDKEETFRLLNLFIAGHNEKCIIKKEQGEKLLESLSKLRESSEN